MRRFSTIAIISAALSVPLSLPALAGEVMLKSRDGAFSMTGDLRDFRDGSYIINSVFGEVAINAAEVDCIGDACQVFLPQTSEFGIAGLAILTRSLVPALLVEYGQASGYKVSIGAGGQAGTMAVTFDDGKDKPAAVVSVSGNGTVGGYRDLVAKRASIVVAGRPPDPAEVRSIAESGQGDLSASRAQEVVAMEALVFLVSDQNPVRSLTTQQIDDIFTGKITNWADVGSYDQPINVYRRREGDAITNVLRNDLMHDKQAPLVAAATTIPDEDSLSDRVAADPYGIGFSHYSEIGDARALAVRGTCGILASPTPFNIKSEEYPYSHRLYAFVPDGPLPAVAQGFMDYVMTDAAQLAVERAGFISGNIDTATADQQGYRFANAILASQDEVGLRDLLSMTESLIDAERLSTTLRFETSSSQLDVRAEADLKRLVSLFSQKDFSSREIMLVGYSDSVGNAASNANLARRRAEQVLARIREIAPAGVLDGLQFSTSGRGEVSPIACNDAPNGRFVNRRVEVWIRAKT